MKYALLVARREYVENARTKGFWIGILLFPTIVFLMLQVPIWLEKKATPIRYFVLVDQSGELEPVVESSLERARQKPMLDALNDYARKNSVPQAESGAAARAAGSLAQFNEANPQSLEAFIRKGGKDFFLGQLRPRLKPNTPAFKEPQPPFQRVGLPAGIKADADLAALVQELKPYLRGEKKAKANGQEIDLSIAVLIPRDIDNQIVRPNAGSSRASGAGKGIEYWSVNVADPSSRLREQIEQAVNTEIRRREYLARGMDAGAIRQIEQTYAPVLSLNPKKEAGQEAVNTIDVIRQWAPMGFVYLLWVAIFSIVQMLLNNIIEEKSNRIIEVLLSSVTPGELMTGKLAGIAAIGLTMVCAWMAALFGILNWKAGGVSGISGQLLTVLKTSNLLPVFAIYFLLGYVLYSALILSLGSVCNTLKEAQSYMAAVTMIMMVPLMTITFIPKDPNGVVARVLSWIPIYTPFVMMNRATADPPLLDVIGTMVLLLVSVGVALWVAGRIFRIGILRTGQPPRIIEMLRWLKG